MRLKATAITIAILLAGCGLFDSGSNWRSGKFEVIWIDVHTDSHLAYRLDSTTSIGVVESCVIAAGANEKYIVVKQIRAGHVNYYAAEKAKFSPLKDSRDAINGPLTQAAYESLGNTIALPALESVLPVSACGTAA